VSDYEAAQRRRDVVVGIFVILGLGALGWMILKFGDLPTTITRMQSFRVYAQFPTAPGVMKDTPVRFCGYQIGRVTTVMPPEVREDLDTQQKYHQTLCVLSINKRYRDIPCNVDVKLMTRGLGSSYLELKVDPGRLPAKPRDANDPSTCFLKEGMSLQGSSGLTSEFFPEESQQKLERLVEDIRMFIGNANRIIGDPNNQQNFKATLANLSKTSDAFPDAVDSAIAMMKDAQKTMEEFRRLRRRAARPRRRRQDGTARGLDGRHQQRDRQTGATAAGPGEGQQRPCAARLINDGRFYESLLEHHAAQLPAEGSRALIDKASGSRLRSIY
jgi:phospholipid/cholesterol/gamma-HCH transport system substrate-binding protein